MQKSSKIISTPKKIGLNAYKSYQQLLIPENMYGYIIKLVILFY